MILLYADVENALGLECCTNLRVSLKSQVVHHFGKNAPA